MRTACFCGSVGGGGVLSQGRGWWCLWDCGPSGWVWHSRVNRYIYIKTVPSRILLLRETNVYIKYYLMFALPMYSNLEPNS